MKVDRVFISTYRYDFHFAKVCIASIRYWYPEIPIFLIKDEKEGRFDSSYVEKNWNVKVLDTTGKKFGWGYGKLETLFLDVQESFFVIDADAVITGPVFGEVEKINADFVVDKEEQDAKRFNEIYFNLSRIKELDADYVYPAYSFNTGQWFGTSGLIKRNDFDKTLNWSQPPATKDKNIVVNNDQGHLNYVVHCLQKSRRISVARIKLMIWPVEGRSDFISVDGIKSRSNKNPYVIHWAGMSGMRFSDLPRQDILQFYKSYYYSRSTFLTRISDSVNDTFLTLKRKVAHRLNRKY